MGLSKVKSFKAMYYLIHLIAFGLSLFPPWLSYALARTLGRFIYYVIPIRRKVAQENVERVYKDTISAQEKKRIVLRSYQTLAILGIETLRLRYMSKEKLLKTLQVRGNEYLESALAQDKGVVVFAGHFGHIVLCGCAEAARGVPVHVIAKGLHNKAAEKFYFETLKKFGVQRLATRRSKEQILAALSSGAAVYMVVDQHMPAHRGLVCRFFNQLASTTPAPTRFALQTGSPIIPCQTAMLDKAGEHEIRYRAEFVLDTSAQTIEDSLRINTEGINRIIEEDLKRKPEQWLWQHKRWKVQDQPKDWNIPDDLMTLVQENN